MMPKNRRIYLLSPQDLSPETIAVTFAKTSRSPKPFDEIAAELTDERSAQFHEKWVVGYGHASVAEHTVLHLALEYVSRLAIETIEGNRLASYTEKSTRYQTWDGTDFHVPKEVCGTQFETPYIDICNLLFDTYASLAAKTSAYLHETYAREEGESETAFTRRIKSDATDVCRFLLPAASLANVGMTINARALEYAICKMLSHPLIEVREIGETLREVGMREAPTLIKYANCNDYMVATSEKMHDEAVKVQNRAEGDDFALIDYDQAGEDAVLAAVLFRFGSSRDYHSCVEYVRTLSDAQRQELVETLMSDRGKYDQPLREFEYAQITFDVVMDQGAYFEFKRHRMMTQTVQQLTADLGFALPKVITDCGCEEEYLQAMRRAGELSAKMVDWNPDVASYILPNGYNRRVLFTMNLREAFHFCRLRAAKNAHFSIRRVAYHVAETINQIYPLLGQYLDVPPNETHQGITDKYFSETKIN